MALQEARLEAQAQLEWTQRHVRELSAELAHAQVGALADTCELAWVGAVPTAAVPPLCARPACLAALLRLAPVPSLAPLPPAQPFPPPLPSLLQSSVSTSAAGVEALVQKVNQAISGSGRGRSPRPSFAPASAASLAAA